MQEVYSVATLSWIKTEALHQLYEHYAIEISPLFFLFGSAKRKNSAKVIKYIQSIDIIIVQIITIEMHCEHHKNSLMYHYFVKIQNAITKDPQF